MVNYTLEEKKKEIKSFLQNSVTCMHIAYVYTI